MKLIELLRKSFVVLMLSFMALAILSACASSEESAPPPEETGAAEGGDPDDCEDSADDNPYC
jgi:hypothetical protein